MTHRDKDKMGHDEFGDAPDAKHNAKVEARQTKEARAKTEQGQRTYGSRKVGESHMRKGGR